jgi:hypothetical protein
MARLLWVGWRRRVMEDHAVRALVGWVLQLRFSERPFQNVVSEIGHRAALSFGLVIEGGDQMPFDGG